MKRTKFSLVLLPLLAIGLITFISNKNGSPGGKTGSPADGNSCTLCHSGSPVSAEAWISSSIPAEGYKADSTYTISLNANHSGVVNFGFEITAEDLSSNKVGQFIITDATQTKLANGNNAVTHTSNGTSPNGESKSWSFDWTAPSADSGDIVFYAAINAANGNSSPSGDIIYTTSDTISFNSTTSIIENTISKIFNFYPNPASSTITIETENTELINIFDFAGKEVYSKQVKNKEIIDISGFKAGVYFIKSGNSSVKLIKE